MVGNISDRQNESETTAITPARFGLDIANRHSPTARKASAARTLVARIYPMTQVIRKREARKISRLAWRYAPPRARLPPSACPTYWIRNVHEHTWAATLKNWATSPKR